MRSSLTRASAVLAFGLALSACSGGAGSTSSLPSSAQSLSPSNQIVTHVNGRDVRTIIMPGAKLATGSCPGMYAFCIEVTPGDKGPYVSTSAGSGYELYNAAYIERSTKTTIDKRFKTYFSPDPGNPTYQYIIYKGKGPKAPTPFKWTDFYCIGFAPSDCGSGQYTFKIGISLNPRS